MATQIIEFTAETGESFTSVTAVAVGTTSPVKTSTSVSEVADGLYQATFTDQNIPNGLTRFSVYAGTDFIGQGLVDITGATGTFRETIEATATVDAMAVADAINENGVDIAGFKDAALDQLRAAEIDLQQWDPETNPMKIYMGMDYLDATDNAFHFIQPDGLWPDLAGKTVQLEVRVAGVTANIGTATVVVANGANQHVYVEITHAAFNGKLIKPGTGVFNVVRVDGSNRFPMASGVVTLVPTTAG